MGRLWFKIESMDQVYEKIEKLSYLNSDATILRTADILDHQGNRIGAWFSYFFSTPVKVDPETRWWKYRTRAFFPAAMDSPGHKLGKPVL